MDKSKHVAALARVALIVKNARATMQRVAAMRDMTNAANRRSIALDARLDDQNAFGTDDILAHMGADIKPYRAERGQAKSAET